MKPPKIFIFASLLLCFSASLFFFTSCTFKPNESILRLGFMPNVTHATALIGIEKGFFQEELGRKIKFKPVHFVVGNSIIDAFITNQIDVAYMGPGPFINAIYRKIPIKLLSNSCNGGTVIVGGVPGPRVQDGMRIAVPQYGNTQDLILRAYLEKNNLSNKIKIFAISPQDTATAFFTMSIDGACLPEPWGTILIKNNICKLLVNENNILNNGNYPVTVLVSKDDFIKNHPEVIKRILIAHKRSNDFINNFPGEAVEIVKNAISNISKKEIDKSIISESFKRCTFKDEIDLNILEKFKAIGVKAGYYKEGFTLSHENYLN